MAVGTPPLERSATADAPVSTLNPSASCRARENTT